MRGYGSTGGSRAVALRAVRSPTESVGCHLTPTWSVASLAVGDDPPPGYQDLSREQAAVDALLDDPVFFDPYRAHFSPRWGRPSIPIETYLRMMFLKHRYELGYETLCRRSRTRCRGRVLPDLARLPGAAPLDPGEDHLQIGCVDLSSPSQDTWAGLQDRRRMWTALVVQPAGALDVGGGGFCAGDLVARWPRLLSNGQSLPVRD